MEALRISRQDNPFLQVNLLLKILLLTYVFIIYLFQQVIASRESLVDSMEESESDDTNLMSQVI